MLIPDTLLHMNHLPLFVVCLLVLVGLVVGFDHVFGLV